MGNKTKSEMLCIQQSIPVWLVNFTNTEDTCLPSQNKPSFIQDAY